MKKSLLLLPFLFLASCGQSGSMSTSVSSSITPSSETESSVSESKEEEVSSVEEVSHDVDVILLMGQSNAEGHSLNGGLTQSQQTEGYQGYPDIQISYHNIEYGRVHANEENFEAVKLGQGMDKNTFGLELGVARVLSENHCKAYILKYTSGGTNLDTQWKAPSSQLYSDFLLFCYERLGILEDQGLNPTVRGVLWMQGEADALVETMANAYEENETNFFNQIRSDFVDYQDDNHPIQFIDSEISDATKPGGDLLLPYYETVNTAKANVAQEENCHLIESTTLGLVNNPSDMYHYLSPSLLKLGEAFGQMVLDVALTK